MRVCANVMAAERQEAFDEICPENGLSFQQYKCAECNASLSFSKYLVDVMGSTIEMVSANEFPQMEMLEA